MAEAATVALPWHECAICYGSTGTLASWETEAWTWPSLSAPLLVGLSYRFASPDCTRP
jgi:hypothetical protein